MDKDKKDVKRSDLWLSLLMILISFAMAFILFVVPRPPLRAYYPASVSCLISFLFLVKYYITAYKFDFSRWLCYLILIICLFLSPRFILPHYSLKIQSDIHKHLDGVFQNRAIPYIVLKGPTYNLDIGFTDPARSIEIKKGMYLTDASPLVNW